MMPTSWASRRSMARWGLPVLVGPRTAVTPRPRTGPELGRGRLILAFLGPTDSVSACICSDRNKGGTNLVRVADSDHSDFVLCRIHEIESTPQKTAVRTSSRRLINMLG